MRPICRVCHPNEFSADPPVGRVRPRSSCRRSRRLPVDPRRDTSSANTPPCLACVSPRQPANRVVPSHSASRAQPPPLANARSRAFGLVLGNEAVERRFNNRPLAKAPERGKTATLRKCKRRADSPTFAPTFLQIHCCLAAKGPKGSLNAPPAPYPIRRGRRRLCLASTAFLRMQNRSNDAADNNTGRSQTFPKGFPSVIPQLPARCAIITTLKSFFFATLTFRHL